MTMFVSILISSQIKPLPYCGPIGNKLNPGCLLRIRGEVHHNAKCFAINLQYGPNTNPRDDVALHLSPVFTSPPRLVRNSIQAQRWGPEESHGPYFPLVAGQTFEILLLCEPDYYKIAINGQHFSEFKHRMPWQSVTFLAIDGEVMISLIQFEGSSSALPPPAHTGMSGGFVRPQSNTGSYVPPPGRPPMAHSATSSPYHPGPQSYPTGAQPYPPVAQPYPTGTQPYATGTQPYPTGTQPYPTGSRSYAPVPSAYPVPNPYQASTGYYPHKSVGCMCRLHHHFWRVRTNMELYELYNQPDIVTEDQKGPG
ncbi:Galectin-4 [Nymphon striatum]|nr:Galectin-4 [Nymphon striatum]